MTNSSHDTLADLDRGTPAVFVIAARGLPVLIGAQFLLAGQALYAGQSWSSHSLVGLVAGLPVLVIAGSAMGVARLRGYAWWAGAVLTLYILQIVLAVSGPAMLAFHPFNAALLLTASLVVLFKVERRRACHQTMGD